MKNIILVLSLILICACATTRTTSELKSLDLGMSKDQVVKVLGEPKAVRGAIINNYGQNVEVWEYHLTVGKKTSTGGKIAIGIIGTAFVVGTAGLGLPFLAPDMDDYWFYFVDGELSQWGKAGDWDVAKRQVLDIKFNSEPSLN